MTTTLPDDRPRPPSPPAAPPRPSFPLIAALAPVLSAAILYALTSSPYTLALAALGPVVAVASYLDGLRIRRRTRRAEAARFDRELHAYEAAIAQRTDIERAALERATPAPSDVLAGALPVDARWRRSPRELDLVLGRGAVQHGAGASRTVLPDAPLLARLSSGIGIVGPRVIARAFARGLLLQCAELVPPEALTVVLPAAADWDGMRSLPHCRAGGAAVRLVVGERGPNAIGEALAGEYLVVLAGRAEDLPTACRCVVQLGGPLGDSVVGRTRPGETEELRAEFVSREQARRYAEGLAASTGGAAGAAIPDSVLLRELGALRRVGGESGLPVVLGTTSTGPLEIDLVRDGPHAIIGGTTGSGKSELLVAWIIALAARHGPSAVTFLLADFKGGAGFGALGRLPHVTGVITDLDPDGATRAFASVAAELRRRELVLAEHGVADIARLPPGVLARLVIVVDECAVVLERAPELHRTFADIAARGRSLGIHLVLCTQRPVGVVRDAVAANCALRIALRVHDPADSRSLIGSDSAARISHGTPGRCIVSSGGRERLAQSALARPEDITAALVAEDAIVRVHRPWLDPLPAALPLPEAGEERILLGVVDRPDAQRQDRVALDRASLLVLGAAGSGRTGVLRTLAVQLPTARIIGASDPEEAWDTLTAPEEPGPPLLVDDLDLLLRRCGDEERRRLLDGLSTLLRTGGRLLVVTARRPTDGISALKDAFDDVLLLRASTRQEHQLLAGHGEAYRGDLPPGGGWWRGERLQVFSSPGPPRVARPSSVPRIEVGRTPIAVLTNRGESLRGRLQTIGVPVLTVAAAGAGGIGGEAALVLGSVQEWSAARQLLSDLRRRGAVVLDVPPGEARILLGPLGPAPLCIGERVLLEREGSLQRARWPSFEDHRRRESAVDEHFEHGIRDNRVS